MDPTPRPMSVDAMGAVLDSGLPTDRRFVLLMVADESDASVHHGEPDIGGIASRTGLSESRVAFVLDWLVEHAHLTVESGCDDHVGSDYRISVLVPALR